MNGHNRSSPFGTIVMAVAVIFFSFGPAPVYAEGGAAVLLSTQHLVPAQVERDPSGVSAGSGSQQIIVTTPQRWFGVFLSLLFFGLVLIMVKRQALSITYAWPWLVAAVVMGVSAFWFERIVLPFSHLLGIHIPLLLLLLLGFLLLLLVTFRISLKQSKTDLLLRNLAQELAIARVIFPETHEIKRD